MKEKQQNFTEGAILPALMKFALPVLMAMLLQAMYGAVDLQVVGKFGTAADISAVATGGQIMHSITIIITGLAMGVTVLLGQKIGEGRPEEAGAAVGSIVGIKHRDVNACFRHAQLIVLPGHGGHVENNHQFLFGFGVDTAEG